MMIAERLKRAREARGLTQGQVAARVELDQSTVAHWERGKSRPSPEKLDRLAPLLGVDAEWLLFGRGRGPVGDSAPAQDGQRRSRSVVTPDLADDASGPVPNGIIPGPGAAASLTMVRDLPIRGRAQGGPEGILDLGTDDRPIDWTYRPPELVGVREAFAVYVDGGSMTSAGFRHGATVWVHPHRRPAPGDIVVLVTLAGQAFVKRYVRSAGGKIVISQSDPPKELAFPLSEIRGLHLVIGGLFGR